MKRISMAKNQGLDLIEIAPNAKCTPYARLWIWESINMMHKKKQI